MAVTSESSAPYAPYKAIIDLIQRYREKGMQTPFTAEVLGRAGITDSLISRTIQALQVLELIDEEGNPTPTFEGIRSAPETDYKQRLGEWIKGVYSDVFSFVDPMTDDQSRIRDAFRTYKPHGQQARMVSLFNGLCMEAGLAPAAKKKSKASTYTRRVKEQLVKPRDNRTKTGQKVGHSIVSTATGDIPSALAGLLGSLPPNGNGWTKERRDQFVTTFGVVLDFCYPITENDKEEEVFEE